MHAKASAVRAVDINGVGAVHRANYGLQFVDETLLYFEHLMHYRISVLLEQEYFVVQNVLDLLDVVSRLHIFKIGILL